MRTKKYYENKILIAAAMFLLLTMLKVLLPEQTHEFRELVSATVTSDTHYMESLRDLGEEISEAGFLETVFGFGESVEEMAEETVEAVNFEPKTLDDLRAEHMRLLPKQSAWSNVNVEDKVTEQEIVTPEPSAEPTEQEAISLPEPPESVTAFLEAQSAFSNYAVPVNVSYDYPTLPFEYTPPVDGELTSSFGYREHPVDGGIKFHYGTDYAVWSGVEVSSMAEGTVSFVGDDPEGYGNYVVVSHADGWETLYAHCSEVWVESGEAVAMGESIGLSGATGNVTGPHLHMELRCNGLYYNPEFYL